MQEQRLQYLLEQYAGDNATEAEQEELSQYFRDNHHSPLFSDALCMLMERYPATASEVLAIDPDTKLADNAIIVGELLANQQYVQLHQTSKTFTLSWSWVAASIILLLATGAYFLFSDKNIPVVRQQISSIDPGTAGAILTLSDNSKVVLDSLGNGIITTQNGVEVTLQNHQLSYLSPNGAKSSEAVYHTLTIPKGRQFSLVLPDGTKVWLNSASSIRFPTVFAEKERLITITGEAYLEVAQNAAAPFFVNVNNKASIEVLGTQFNINAYDDEDNIQTTLLEGSVRVNLRNTNKSSRTAISLSNGVILKPGQLATIPNVLSNTATPPAIKVTSNANVEKAMAWKNGLFNFEGASLEEVMKQLERWYDIKVVYESNIPPIRFGGKMTRNISLNDLLMILEESKVHFRMEGRTLIVQP